MKRNEEYLLPGTLFLLIGIALFMKYVALKNVVVDGGGIGIYLFDFIEINDSVPTHEIPHYANGFLIASILFFLGSLYTLYKSFKQKLS